MLTLIASFTVLISVFLPWTEIMMVHFKGIDFIVGMLGTLESSIGIVMLILISVSGICLGMSKAFRQKNNVIVDVVFGSVVLGICFYLRYSINVGGTGTNLSIAGGVLFLAAGLRKLARRKVASKT